MSEHRAAIIDWLDARIGRESLVIVESAPGRRVASLRGRLQQRVREEEGDYVELDDGGPDIGVGQPGFAVPDALQAAFTVDDFGLRFARADDLVVRLVLV